MIELFSWQYGYMLMLEEVKKFYGKQWRKVTYMDAVAAIDLANRVRVIES